MTKTKNLILITSEFPFGSQETFLETEFPYLCRHFDSVIVIAQTTDSNIRCVIPHNVTLIQKEFVLSAFDKMKLGRFFFRKEVLQEIRNVRRLYQRALNWGILKTILVSYRRSLQMEAFLDRILMGMPDGKTYLYSYWSDDGAIAIGRLKSTHPSLIVFSRAHGWDVYFEPSIYKYLPFRTFLLNHLSAVFCVSKKGVDYIANRWRADTDSPVYLSRLGVAAPLQTRSTHGRFTIVSCSSCIPLKRVHLIIEALQQLRGVHLRWIHFGDGPLLETLKASAARLIPPEIEVVFKGRVLNSEVLQFYREEAPSLFINVSESEGVPVSIMESMAYSIPVIASDVGGNSEIVNAENGFLLPADLTGDDLAALLRQLVQQPDKLASRALAAYNTWGRHFNADMNFPEFLDKLDNLI